MYTRIECVHDADDVCLDDVLHDAEEARDVANATATACTVCTLRSWCVEGRVPYVLKNVK